jgi:hypothetical protein
MAQTVPSFDEAKPLIMEEIKHEYPDASDFTFNVVDGAFANGNVYFVEFKSKELKPSESYYYTFVDRKGCEKLDDRIEDMIRFVRTKMLAHRSFFERLGDFEFLDVVSALIALPIVSAFVYRMCTSPIGTDAVSKEFLDVVEN